MSDVTFGTVDDPVVQMATELAIPILPNAPRELVQRAAMCSRAALGRGAPLPRIVEQTCKRIRLFRAVSKRPSS